MQETGANLPGCLFCGSDSSLEPHLLFGQNNLLIQLQQHKQVHQPDVYAGEGTKLLSMSWYRYRFEPVILNNLYSAVITAVSNIK